MNYGKYTLLIEQIWLDLNIMIFVCYKIHIAPKITLITLIGPDEVWTKICLDVRYWKPEPYFILNYVHEIMQTVV